MAHPLDEYPIHQVARSMAYVGPTDKDFYDRNIFHVVPHGQVDMQMIAGYGVYPNLGVQDAYCCVRVGSTQHVMRASDVMSEDRMTMQVGPFRIEVIDPLRSVRLVCDGGPDEVSCDLVWTAAVPVHDEAHHEMVVGTKTVLDASRFLGIGSWEGRLAAGGEQWDITPDEFTATRDRSWGIRPVGEAVGAGRYAEEIEPSLHWFWVPLRFEDFSTIVIIQEERDGFRILNDAVRLWPADSGRGPEQVGWPSIDVTYSPGTRSPEHATIHLATRDREPLTIDVELLGNMPLNVGCGYGGDPDWAHGEWKGRDWVERVAYDLTDPVVAGRLPFSVTDHVARATCDGRVGYGIFEHGTIGRHDPSGFADLFSVAP